MAGDDGSGEMGFQHCAEMMLNCPSSDMNTRSLPEKGLQMTMGSIYGSSWDPIVSLCQSQSLGGSSSMICQSELVNSSSLLSNQGISTSSHIPNYASDPHLAQMLQKLPISGSGNFPGMRDTFGLPGVGQYSRALGPKNYALNQSSIAEKPSVNAVQSEREGQFSEGKLVGISPTGKRKREPEPPSPTHKKTETDTQENSSGNSGIKEQEDKKQKSEQNATSNSSGKQAGNQVKESSQDEDASKQNYVHVRARRGQATNSHSLAERIRREKISERMRLLQELVPGCNKITGKAVMLDEIINYVQSLQQQVEFLSMKLATVNPELNIDIDQILSKDIIHSQRSGAPSLAYDQALSSYHSFMPGLHPGLAAMPNGASQYHNMSQAVWENDVQSLLQMGFDSNMAVRSLGPNSTSSSKNEL